tara:strand:- start:2769 stop:3434 length:666 start_codon:yes stop_codon:yes gene_type:complete
MSNKRLTDFQRCHMEHMRNAGASYRTIAATLKLSKGTISYHLTPGQKEKSKLRVRKRREEKLVKKADSFFDRKLKIKKVPKTQRPERILEHKVRSFYKHKHGGSTKGLDMKSRAEKMIEKFWPNGVDQYGNKKPYTLCRYTGVKINFEARADEPDFATFDHMKARSRGGENSVENAQTLHGVVNAMKGDREEDEFFWWIDAISEGTIFKKWKEKQNDKIRS